MLAVGREGENVGFQARRDSLQSSAKRNMVLCSLQELWGRERREEGVCVHVHACMCACVCVGEEEDKGFPRALSWAVAKRCIRYDKA